MQYCVCTRPLPGSPQAVDLGRQAPGNAAKRERGEGDQQKGAENDQQKEGESDQQKGGRREAKLSTRAAKLPWTEEIARWSACN